MTAKATINMLKQKNLAVFIISLLAAGLFVFSFFCYIITKNTCRRAFIFPSAENGKYIIEYRNLAEKPHQGDIGLYIDEILLDSLSVGAHQEITVLSAFLEHLGILGDIRIDPGADLKLPLVIAAKHPLYIRELLLIPGKIAPVQRTQPVAVEVEYIKRNVTLF